jgi:hypothetical protein
MRTLGLLALLVLTGPAFAAETPAQCRVAEPVIEVNFPLPQVTKAVANKKLDVLVLGAGSSTLPGADGEKSAYPARLQNALAQKLPGIAVKVTADVKSGREAPAVVKGINNVLASAKPALVVWQTGTVDAMRSLELDAFSEAVDNGVAQIRGAGADVVLVNAQYSPRTEFMIAINTYAEEMRRVAVQREIPLFDRLAVMKLWAELGTFDFYTPTKKLDMALQVHDCIGRLLADLIIEAAKPAAPQSVGR